MGSLAGIYYGIESISKEWTQKLQKKDYLLSLKRSLKRKIIIYF